MVDDLLQTKIIVPPRRLSLVPRLRLIEKLNKGLQQSHKLTLISAPAGFGKTTLVSEWVQNLELDSTNQIANRQSKSLNQAVWLSLDENDNDLTRFLAYFIAALDQSGIIDAAFSNEAISKLQSSQPTKIEPILTLLINEITAVSDKIIFVLDDYHLIEAQPIHDALTFLVENMPPQMHLVIATREDPFLPLSRFRVRSQMSELRAADLRFTNAEAADFLNRVMGLTLSGEDIAALEKRTEGWIAGLQLAAISLQGRKNTSSLIQSFTGSHRLVLDYLIEDVLNQQPEHIQNFLLQTAVLNHLAGPLCDAVTGQENSQSILEMLDRANLFVIPLDNERQWYRYHHLFADMLQTRLRAQQLNQVTTLHLRASRWFDQNGMVVDAIRHALAGQDFARAADLAEFAWPAWSGEGESRTWLSWVRALPDELVRNRPVLSVAFAQALLNVGDLEAAETRLLDVESLLASPDGISDQQAAPSSKMIFVDEEQFQALPAWLATTRAYHAQALGNLPETVKYVGQALDLFPEEDQYSRAAVTGLLGLAYWAGGDLEAAHSTFSNGLFQNVHDRIKGTFVLADMKMALGQLHEAKRICEHGLQLAKAFDPPMPIGTEDIYSGLSEIHREQGNLETAVQDLQLCKNLGEQVEMPDWQHRWCIAQARLDMTLGNLDAALDLLDKASRVYVRTPVPEIRPIAAMKVRVWIKQGRLTEALAWAREHGLSVDDDLSYMREFEHLTLVRALIAQYKLNKSNGSIHEVMDLLERLLKAAEEKSRIGSIMEILTLQALAFEAQGNISSALKTLERTLTLAAPEGYFQLFVDEGLPMARLLQEAQSRGIETNYVQRLLSAFPAGQSGPTLPSQPQTQGFDWIEPLSEREIEVLQLIADGLTNPEIAARLFLSLNTVKVHTRNIYGKLDVHSRTQAVARARGLGILSI